MPDPIDCSTCEYHAEMEKRVAMIDGLTERHQDLLQRHVEALEALRAAIDSMRERDAAREREAIETRVHTEALRKSLDELAVQLREKAAADTKRDTEQAVETARLELQVQAVKGELLDAARAGAREGAKVSWLRALGIFFGSPLALLAMWALLYALGVPVPAPSGGKP